MSMLEEVAAYIETNGIATRTVNLFAAHMPPSPGDAISLVQSGGGGPVDTWGGLDHEELVLYVNLRWSTYPTGHSKIYSIFTLLHRFEGTLSSTRYLSILARSSPVALGTDENNRHRWSLTFDVRKELS